MRYNVEHMTHIISGHTIEGWSDDTDAFMIERRTLTNVKTGAAGDDIHFRTGDKGATVTIKLLPNSPSNDFLSGLRNAYLEGGIVNVDCETVHHQAGTREFGEFGSFLEDDPGQQIGKGDAKNREWKFRYGTYTEDRTGSLLANPVPVTE